MTSTGRRDWRAIGCAALVGASIALPLGMAIGGEELPPDNARSPNASSRGQPPARNIYSPAVTSDPYVIEQQRRVAEALEMSCRQSGRLCAEAEQARLRIEEAEAGK